MNRTHADDQKVVHVWEWCYLYCWNSPNSPPATTNATKPFIFFLNKDVFCLPDCARQGILWGFFKIFARKRHQLQIQVEEVAPKTWSEGLQYLISLMLDTPRLGLSQPPAYHGKQLQFTNVNKIGEWSIEAIYCKHNIRNIKTLWRHNGLVWP